MAITGIGFPVYHQNQAFVDQALAGQVAIPTVDLMCEVEARTDPDMGSHKLASVLKTMLQAAPALDGAARHFKHPVADALRDSQEIDDKEVVRRAARAVSSLQAVVYRSGQCFHYNWDMLFEPSVPPEQLRAIERQFQALPGVSDADRATLQRADQQAEEMFSQLHPAARWGGMLSPKGIEEHPNPNGGWPGSHVLKGKDGYTDYDVARNINQGYITAFTVLATPPQMSSG